MNTTAPLTIFAPLHPRTLKQMTFRECGMDYVDVNEHCSVGLSEAQLDQRSIEIVVPVCVDPYCGCKADVSEC